jgi:hypothetical protein
LFQFIKLKIVTVTGGEGSDPKVTNWLQGGGWGSKMTNVTVTEFLDAP